MHMDSSYAKLQNEARNWALGQDQVPCHLVRLPATSWLLAGEDLSPFVRRQCQIDERLPRQVLQQLHVSCPDAPVVMGAQPIARCREPMRVDLLR